MVTLLDRGLYVIPNGGGAVAYPLKAGDGITTYPPGADPRPCQWEDWLSVQPDGSFQGRTSIGAWETFQRDGLLLIATVNGFQITVTLPIPQK